MVRSPLHPHPLPLLLAAALLAAPRLLPGGGPPPAGDRLRLIIETDAGGDPDDEQSLVRFLLYANEWDIEGIIANRERARDGENLNPERTGPGIVRRLIDAYGACWPNLEKHDPRYPPPDRLRAVTVRGYRDTGEGVDLVIAAVDSPDPRPVWFLNWGTDHGSAPSCLLRALDRVLRERGQAGYAAFKSRLRLSSAEAFGDHSARDPPWPIWVDTFRPEIAGRRWYHRFSAITARAGGFDVERDVRTGHGPLGALYPLNTTHPQKEGDSMTFLYLVPTGMNDPDRPEWGSWAGRYGRRADQPGRPYYWADQEDDWEGTRSRENTLARWAAALQDDFRARLDWCVKPYREANHPPRARLEGPAARAVLSGERVELSAAGSGDPNGDGLDFGWTFYPEASGYRGPLALRSAGGERTSFTAPRVESPCAIHIVLSVTDDGKPPLTRYRRAVITVDPPPVPPPGTGR